MDSPHNDCLSGKGRQLARGPGAVGESPRQRAPADLLLPCKLTARSDRWFILDRFESQVHRYQLIVSKEIATLSRKPSFGIDSLVDCF